jgi:hypothetical protein
MPVFLCRPRFLVAFNLLILLTLSLPCAAQYPGGPTPATRLNEVQAVYIARAFCRKIGQPVTATGTATFAADAQDLSNHYWQPIWEVTFPAQAEVEVVDATGIITRYANDAYDAVHRNDNSPAGDPISQPEAVQRARAAVDATGQPEPLLFWEAQTEQRHLFPPLAKTYQWTVRWHRAAGGVSYRNQHASVALDAQTGEVEYMVIMFGGPPLESARKVLGQDDAISVAASQVISQIVQQEATLKEAHPEIVWPDPRWPHSSDKQGQPKGVRLAWAVTFIVDGVWHQADVDTETGEVLSVAADGGPMGMHVAAVPKAAPTPPPIAPMLQAARAVYVRGRDAGGKWAIKPLLKFSNKTQPHAVAVLRKTADFRKEGPAGDAPQELIVVGKSDAIGVYSYFPETGLLGGGSEWAAVPDEFKAWVQRKIATAGLIPAQGAKK